MRQASDVGAASQLMRAMRITATKVPLLLHRYGGSSALTMERPERVCFFRLQPRGPATFRTTSEAGGLFLLHLLVLLFGNAATVRRGGIVAVRLYGQLPYLFGGRGKWKARK